MLLFSIESDVKLDLNENQSESTNLSEFINDETLNIILLNKTKNEKILTNLNDILNTILTKLKENIDKSFCTHYSSLKNKINQNTKSLTPNFIKYVSKLIDNILIPLDELWMAYVLDIEDVITLSFSIFDKQKNIIKKKLNEELKNKSIENTIKKEEDKNLGKIEGINIKEEKEDNMSKQENDDFSNTEKNNKLTVEEENNKLTLEEKEENNLNVKENDKLTVEEENNKLTLEENDDNSNTEENNKFTVEKKEDNNLNEKDYNNLKSDVSDSSMNEVNLLKNENLQSNKKKKNGDNSNSESQSNEESKKKLLSLKNKEDDNIVNKINHYFENLDNESNDANEELQFEKDIENHEGNIMKDKNKLIKDYDDLKSQNTKKQSLMHKDLLDIKNTEEHYTVNDDDLRFKNNEIQPSENIKFNDLNVDNLLNNSRKELLKFIKLASTEINYILNIYKQYLFQYIDNGSQIMSNEFKCKIFKNNSEECKIAESYLIDTTKKVQNNINDIIEKSSVEIINVLLN